MDVAMATASLASFSTSPQPSLLHSNSGTAIKRKPVQIKNPASSPVPVSSLTSMRSLSASQSPVHGHAIAITSSGQGGAFGEIASSINTAPPHGVPQYESPHWTSPISPSSQILRSPSIPGQASPGSRTASDPIQPSAQQYFHPHVVRQASMPVNNSATNPDPQQYPMPLLHPTQSAPEPPRPSMVSAASAPQIPQTYDEQLTNRTSKTSKMRKMSNGVNSWVKKHPVIATSVAISGAVVVEAAGLVVGVDAVKDAALINRGVNKFQARRKASQIAQKQPDTIGEQAQNTSQQDQDRAPALPRRPQASSVAGTATSGGAPYTAPSTNSLPHNTNAHQAGQGVDVAGKIVNIVGHIATGHTHTHQAHQNFASGPQQQALQQQNLQQQNLQQQAAFQQQQSAQQQTTLQQQQAYQQQLYQQQLLYQQQTYANGQTPVYLQQQYPAYQQQYPAYQQPPPQYYQQPPVYQDNSINMVDSGGVDPLTMMALSDPGLIDPTATQQVNMNVQDISVNSQQTTVDSTQNVIDPSQLGGASLPTTPDGLQDGSAYVNPPLTPPLSSTDGTGDWGNMANGSDGGDDDGGCDDDEDDDY
ncbi:hypothetical protein LTR59_015101 [Friedmanniomyces endolithicus]|nr:hypothetical protein LTR94_017922 [Friedmanniomyces endolithicus]KAK0773923.1 hypothetical protein LTR59_015101 [Friedmanniomyces endolithicus]KAK0777994.1 hypothetical protein LTR38_014971 [Friedmanniomyces endolithicus]KAK0846896.1 hypothetical protein LTR03_006576 [Friedmanniomyces endolithicus]